LKVKSYFSIGSKVFFFLKDFGSKVKSCFINAKYLFLVFQHEPLLHKLA